MKKYKIKYNSSTWTQESPLAFIDHHNTHSRWPPSFMTERALGTLRENESQLRRQEERDNQSGSCEVMSSGLARRSGTRNLTRSLGSQRRMLRRSSSSRIASISPWPWRSTVFRRPVLVLAVEQTREHQHSPSRVLFWKNSRRSRMTNSRMRSRRLTGIEWILRLETPHKRSLPRKWCA